MPITLAQMKDRLQRLLVAADPADLAGLQGKFGEFMQYSIEHYEQLDVEAKSCTDNAFKRLQKEARAIADKFPESPEKRHTVRQLSLAGGGHFQADDLISILDSPTQHLLPILPAAREAFAQLLQRTLDVLFDATRHTHEGVANFAKIGLCYWAIDELLAASHLAQRAFTNQSYAHIRTDDEILELIELFDRQPEWAELWVMRNDKEVWSKLRPRAVRKKLGAPKVEAAVRCDCGMAL